MSTSDYAVDFTTLQGLPSDWVNAAYEPPPTFSDKGAAFTFSKDGDAPGIWTSFYFFYGTVEVVAQVSPGQGIISDIVLMSDDKDEVDWEFQGSITDTVSTNYFGKGVTGNYDRGTVPPVANPQTQFHTYTWTWTETSLTWSIDGQAVRVLNAADCTAPDKQYPQTPMQLRIGLWDGGAPSSSDGTAAWAGGRTPLPPPNPSPWTYYVKSVKISNSKPAKEYQYSDKSGSSDSIKLIGAGAASSSTSSPTATATAISTGEFILLPFSPPILFY